RGPLLLDDQRVTERRPARRRKETVQIVQGAAHETVARRFDEDARGALHQRDSEARSTPADEGTAAEDPLPLPADEPGQGQIGDRAAEPEVDRYDGRRLETGAAGEERLGRDLGREHLEELPRWHRDDDLRGGNP